MSQLSMQQRFPRGRARDRRRFRVAKRSRTGHHRRLAVEALDTRTMLSVGVPGLADWTDTAKCRALPSALVATPSTTGYAVEDATEIPIDQDRTARQSQSSGQPFPIVATNLAGNAGTPNQTIGATVRQEVQIHLQVRDLSGNPIAAVRPGTQFLLQAYVRDVRPEPDGVFAAYLDIAYDATLVSAVGEDRDDITFGERYMNGKSGTLTTAGLIDEAGAFSWITPTGGEEWLLFSVKMTAQQAGTVTFTGHSAEDVGHETLVYGSDYVVDSEAVAVTPAILTVAAGSAGIDDVFNVGEDSQINMAAADPFLPSRVDDSVAIGNYGETAGRCSLGNVWQLAGPGRDHAISLAEPFQPSAPIESALNARSWAVGVDEVMTGIAAESAAGHRQAVTWTPPAVAQFDGASRHASERGVRAPGTDDDLRAASLVGTVLTDLQGDWFDLDA
jgi:hypothetical protein